jgi:uncharacterized membrane protein
MRPNQRSRDDRQVPSTRPIWLAVLSAVGLAIATYLTAFQVGIVTSVWDPVFGGGSERVLTSPISRASPVPDASLGAVAYALDLAFAIAIVIGVGPRSSLTRLLATVASLAAAMGILLVILQPIVVHALCTLCLASAAISVALAAGAIAEATSARIAHP